MFEEKNLLSGYNFWIPSRGWSSRNDLIATVLQNTKLDDFFILFKTDIRPRKVIFSWILNIGAFRDYQGCDRAQRVVSFGVNPGPKWLCVGGKKFDGKFAKKSKKGPFFNLFHKKIKFLRKLEHQIAPGQKLSWNRPNSCIPREIFFWSLTFFWGRKVFLHEKNKPSRFSLTAEVVGFERPLAKTNSSLIKVEINRESILGMYFCCPDHFSSIMDRFWYHFDRIFDFWSFFP